MPRFSDAIRAGRISNVEQIDGCCILAAVGQQMASRKGVSATMFSALAKANINIRCASEHATIVTPPWTELPGIRQMTARIPSQPSVVVLQRKSVVR